MHSLLRSFPAVCGPSPAASCPCLLLVESQDCIKGFLCCALISSVSCCSYNSGEFSLNSLHLTQYLQVVIQWRVTTKSWQVVCQSLGASRVSEQAHQHTQPFKFCKKFIWFLLIPISGRLLLYHCPGWKQSWVSSLLGVGAHQFLDFSSFMFLNIFSSPMGLKIYKLDFYDSGSSVNLNKTISKIFVPRYIRFVFNFMVEIILSCDFLYPKLSLTFWKLFSGTICWTDILSVLNCLIKL